MNYKDSIQDMNAQDLARMMLDRLGDLASNYDIGENAMDYVESIRRELRPIAWPNVLWDADEDQDAVMDSLEGNE